MAAKTINARKKLEVAAFRNSLMRAKFVMEYLADPKLNATAAVIRAGYVTKRTSAGSIATQLMRDPDTRAEIKRAVDQRIKRTRITADYVLATIFETIERCKQAAPVLDREGNPTGQYVFDAKSVLRGAELLGRHLRMFEQPLEQLPVQQVSVYQAFFPPDAAQSVPSAPARLAGSSEPITLDAVEEY